MAASSSQSVKPIYSATYVSVCLAVNVALSISIILLNKAVYTHVHFPNMTLTCVHFVFTTVGMVFCRCFGLFSFKPLPLKHMVPVSLTFCGFVVLTNLSLQSNAVGTYQIIKSMTTPMIIFIQSVFYARLFSLPVKLTLVRYSGRSLLLHYYFNRIMLCQINRSTGTFYKIKCNVVFLQTYQNFCYAVIAHKV